MLRNIMYYIRPLGSLGFGTVLVIALLLTASAVSALRQNNTRMLELRQAVIDADAEGADVETLRGLIIDLGEHIIGHMNTSMAAPIELVNTYSAANQEQRRRAYESLVPAGIYRAAEDACQAVNPIQRAACITDYVTKNFETSNFAPPEDLPIEEYRFDFAAPRWSADLAGFSIAIASLAWVAVLYEGLTRRLTKFYLKKSLPRTIDLPR